MNDGISLISLFDDDETEAQLRDYLLHLALIQVLQIRP